jgi:serine/threonine-protein kinase
MRVEARAAARLVHPAIVRVFDIDTTEDGAPFIVMELLDGESLSDVLERGPMPAIEAVQTLLPIAEALVLAHEKGIFHRDLKPPNIMLTPHGRHLQPKLLDFGIAKLATSPMPNGSLTETGITIGSPDYMSPEQARGSSDIDYRADIWQLCVVIYEALTTRVPFEGDNYNALMRSIVEDEPQPLALDDQVDQRLVELVTWGLSKQREDRPDSVRTLAQALATWLIAHGVNEDVSGSALGPKWLGDHARASSTEGTSGPLMAKPGRFAHERAVWLLLAGACVVAAWLLVRGISSHPSKSRPAAAVSLVAEPLPQLEAQPAMSPAIASSVAAPAAIPSSESTRSGPGSSASSDPAPSPKPPEKKAGDDSRKHAPAAQSSRVVHDETRELLQAY